MNGTELPTPVLEIGGTHVTAALVQCERVGSEGAPTHRVSPPGLWRVVAGSTERRDLDAHAPAAALLDALAAAGSSLGNGHSGHWGIALPGPFDYGTGIARYRDVGKFDQLQGVDVGAGLAERLRPQPQSITFLNDADAFGIGEFVLGAAGKSRRAVCITLGTGVGSAFLADGLPVKTGAEVPPDGSCYLLQYRGRPLEDTVSRRAIRRAYAAAKVGTRPAGATPGPSLEDHDGGAVDVREIAQACRAGDAVAATVLEEAFAAVGEATGAYLQSFGAEVLVVGGSVAASWDIVEPGIRKGLTAAAPALATLPIRKAERPEEAGLIGAAYWAQYGAKQG